MNTPYTAEQLAEGTIRRGILRLTDRFPFHAKVLEQFQLAASDLVGTIGVRAPPSGVLLLHNPAFVLSLPVEQLDGVLLHEVLHVVFGHITIDRAR